jgi:ABC-type uncharacterized transport system permease subunit
LSHEECQLQALLPRALRRPSARHNAVIVKRGAAPSGLDAAHIPLAALGVGLGLAVYVSASLTFASLAFWFSGARSFARDLTDFMLLFSSYPGSVYAGATKLIAYAILPAGFVVLALVDMIREPTLVHLGIAVAAAIGYAVVAICVFQLGLRRYQRGGTPAAGS